MVTSLFSIGIYVMTLRMLGHMLAVLVYILRVYVIKFQC